MHIEVPLIVKKIFGKNLEPILNHWSLFGLCSKSFMLKCSGTLNQSITVGNYQSLEASKQHAVDIAWL